MGEITAENIPNLLKKTDMQVQEAQRVPNNLNQKANSFKGMINRLMADFLQDQWEPVTLEAYF